MSKDSIQGFSLSEFTCAVIGAGGLGCNIAVHLAGAGVKKLILCDFDKISSRNLNRQFLYTVKDVGKEKVAVAKKKLEEYAPDTEISALSVKITKDNIPAQLRECDMIFLAADNSRARKAISDFSEKNNIPLMMGGIDGFYGKTYLYLPGITPSPDAAGMLDGKRALSNISAAAGIIGSLEAAVGIQYLLTKDTSLGGKLTVYDKDTFSELVIKQKN